MFPFWLPFTAVILKVTDQFFFLAINGYDGVAVLFKCFAGCVDVLKLQIAVRVRDAFDVLLVGLEGEIKSV